MSHFSNTLGSDPINLHLPFLFLKPQEECQNILLPLKPIQTIYQGFLTSFYSCVWRKQTQKKKRETVKILGGSMALQSFVCLSGKPTYLSHFAVPGLGWLVGAQTQLLQPWLFVLLFFGPNSTCSYSWLAKQEPYIQSSISNHLIPMLGIKTSPWSCTFKLLCINNTIHSMEHNIPHLSLSSQLRPSILSSWHSFTALWTN